VYAVPAIIPPSVIGTARRHGRPTSLNPLQWAVLGSALVALLFVIAVNLWLTRAGRAAASGTFAGSLTTAVFDHHVAIRKALAVVALLLAIVNVTLMRIAVIQDFNITREMYRRLRQNHRFVGYTSAVIAITVQALAWIGIAASGSLTGSMLLFIVLGAILLVMAVVKVGTVRFIPSWRRYLPTFGWALLVSYSLVLLANLVLAIP